MNDTNNDDAKESFRKGLDLAAEQFWKGLPALIGALIGAAFLAWLAIRDHGHALGELDARIAIAERCASQRDCEALRAQVHGMELRLREMEVRIQDLRERSGARPDPFTGSGGRELERRIKALEAKP